VKFSPTAPELLLIALWGLSPALAVAASITVRVGDESGIPVANAVVYAVPASEAPMTGKAAGATIDEVNKQFVPYVTVLRSGGAIAFPNHDNIRHEIYSFSPSKIFKLELYSGTSVEPVVFDKPGLVVLGCNIHERMLAFVYVVDTPYFAKTGSEGKARIEQLPAGAYQLRLWHPRLDVESPPRPLTLTADSNAEEEYALVLGPPPMSMQDR